MQTSGRGKKKEKGGERQGMPGMRFVGEASVLVAQPNATKHNRLARCCFERFSKVEKRQFHAGENEREKTKRENEREKKRKRREKNT